MSVCRKLPDGTIQKIAGHTVLLDANASEVRQGRWSMPTSGTPITTTVTFADPMPDTDYIVILEMDTATSFVQLTQLGVHNKTTTGFQIFGWFESSTLGTMSGVYTAFKLIKLDGYTALQNKVNSPDTTPTIDSMNLVTSDGVARAIENASAVWKGTKAEWTALPAADKLKYDLAVLIDKTLVKAIDRTDGSETNVADLSGQFVGTHDEWDAESDKTQYKTAVLTDERKTVNEVTSTGELNEVADDARIWSGTQAAWDAMSVAEKAKWNVAHIEDGSPVFSKHIFPDYTHPITIPSGTTSWTATEDCYVVFVGFNNDFFIDGINVCAVCNNHAISFTGYVKKGSVLSGTSLATAECKIFPLL